ncbi:Scr1 family TA system antitoxin-like transcriptional regulator [Streptomyces sp. NPDC004682]
MTGRFPFEIVLSVYLRALRATAKATLDDVARGTHTSVSTITRWERAATPMTPQGLETLLRYYQVPPRTIAYLLLNCPDPYGRPSARLDSLEHWVDTVSGKPIARHTAVTRAASDAVQVATSLIPSSFRTPAYRAAVTATGLATDELPADKQPPAWLAHAPRPRVQRRTLLLDQTILRHPVGGHDVWAAQLRHLLDLMDNRARPVSIRVLPDRDPTAPHPTAGQISAFAVTGHWMISGCHLAPWYETRTRRAQTLLRKLHNAVANAHGREESYRLIKQAAEREAAS